MVVIFGPTLPGGCKSPTAPKASFGASEQSRSLIRYFGFVHDVEDEATAGEDRLVAVRRVDVAAVVEGEDIVFEGPAERLPVDVQPQVTAVGEDLVVSERSTNCRS